MKFQFSIRDLLLIIAIVALAAGWWIDHQRINRLSVQNWEYKLLWNAQEADVNTFADKGWEACGMSSVMTGNQGAMTFVMIRRPKQ